MPIDWEAPDFDWRDESLDGERAKEYLVTRRRLDRAALKEQPLVDIDRIDATDAWAMELVREDLDAQRGWRLVVETVRLAVEDHDYRAAGRLMAMLLRKHEEFLPNAATIARVDVKFRTALREAWPPSEKLAQLQADLQAQMKAGWIRD